MRTARTFNSLIFENGTYKLVALFITLSLWVVILERKDMVLVKTVDLEFTLPTESVLVNNPTKKVQFKVRGPRANVKRFADSTETINVDLSSAEPGKTVVRLYDDLLQLPPGVRVLNLNPTRVTVEIERTRVKKVPVQLDLPDFFDRDFKLREVVPSEIELQGTESALRDINEVKTKELLENLSEETGDFEIQVELEPIEKKGLLPPAVKTVLIRLTKVSK